jgi:eukaryotic-like serine/threonine-protein kinase
VEVQQMLGGRYQLLDELGSGGTAVVWRARDEVLGRSVAVKLLHGRYADDPLSRARIRDEARAAATLSAHPNIAQVYDFGESTDGDSPLPYVVMELVNGPTLQQQVALGPMPPRTVFRVCGEVASALAAAHADGLVHRDIKPANVMVTPSGVKVVDFGIAAAVGPRDPEDVLLGTPAYLAPERLIGGPVEPATDVYALGVLLYRLLAHESPWSVDTTTQMLSAHIYIDPTPLPDLPGVSPQVTELVQRCLRKAPRERPSAAEAAEILADAADQPPPQAPVRPEPASKVVPVPRSAATGPSQPAGRDTTGAGGSKWAVVVPDGVQRKRRALLAGGGVAAGVVAALLLWQLWPAGAGADPDDARVPPPAAAGRPSVVDDLPGVTVTGTGGVPAGNPTRAGGAVIPGAQQPQAPITQPGAGPTGNVPRTGGTDPAGPPKTTPASSRPASSAPPAGGKTKTLSSAGGTVDATCAGGKVTLVSWAPKPPYEVQRVNAGPIVAAAIIFKNKASRIRMTVTCVAGEPTTVNLPL